jgi:hypothetical protein
MLGRALELTEDNPRATGVNIGLMRADILLLLEHWPADGSGLDPSRFHGRKLEWQS